MSVSETRVGLYKVDQPPLSPLHQPNGLLVPLNFVMKPRSGSSANYKHWKDHVREIVIDIETNEGVVNLPIEGGSEFGHFCYLGTLTDSNINEIKYVRWERFRSGDVLLEIEEQKVAGFTRMDVLAWFNHSCRLGLKSISIKVTEAGLLTTDLRHYLNTRFIKGSADHDLQNTIRDNLYLRTVPCTTRAKRDGEIDGVDYAFLTLDEFLCLERTGNLLESGIYEGNHYGTPKPPKENAQSHSISNGVVSNGVLAESFYLPSVASILFHTNTSSEILLPGAHPSSEGKRRRNRSNVEAMASKSVEPDSRPPPSRIISFGPPTDDGKHLEHLPSPLELGSLPTNWEKAYTDEGEPYFINHTTGSSQWLDPRLARVQKKAIEDCDDDELPYGWEKIDDPQFGTYYIDHINRLTQYENPVLQAKRTKQLQSDNNDVKLSRPVFTRNPSELQGTLIATTLIKGPWGFGFTIIGGDDQTEEFLQIKSVIPNGPAFQDGKLLQGDVLVYVNDTCVLGYTHLDVVSLFQSIPSGEAVLLEVCRGYPLSFDLDDPDNEIVTTLAVNAADGQNASNGKPELDQSIVSPDILYFREQEKDTPEVLTVGIIKGSMGFGFTIADSANGQKVKKILDRPRCKNLMEGDIMLEINSVDVCGLEHAHVVQFLKDCPQGLEAIIKVQRGGIASPSNKSRPRVIGTSQVQDSPNLKGNNLSQPYNFNGTVRRGLYRSKTPTADLYSVVERQVTPVRSKTPIVDTRNRTRSPVENNHPVTVANQKFCDDVRPATIGETLDNSSNHSNSECQSGSVYNKTISNSATRWIPGKSNDDGSHGEIKECNHHTSTVANDNMYSGINNIRIGACTPDNLDSRHRDTNDSFGIHEDPSLLSRSIDMNHWTSNADTNADSNHNPLVRRHDTVSHFQESIPLDYNFMSSNANLYGSVHSSGYSCFGNGHVNNVNNVLVGKGNQFDEFMYSARESLHKQGTSFEHEQPSPVNNSSRHPLSERKTGLSNNWHGVPVVQRLVQKSSRLAGYVDSTMTLYRQESGFGFRIIGGTEEGSQVSIGHIVPGGAADLDGRLKSGDEITTVDGQSVLHTSHHHVVQLMGAASNNGRVTLGVRRRVQPLDIQPTKPAEFIYPYDITVVRRENEGFGFVIISSISKAGSTIGRIIDNSPAQRCGQLHVGDRILAVNGVEILNLHHGDIVNLIKDSGLTVTLTIGTPQDDSSSVTSTSQRVDGAFEDGQYYSAELLRGTRGFGFSIRGGKEFHNMPLFVLRIADGGPAAEDGRLQIGDQLIEINGINTNNMAHGEAIEIIKHGGSLVRLLVKRGNKFFPTNDRYLVNASVTPANVGEFSVPNFTATGVSGPIGQSSPQVAVSADQDLYFWEYERGPV